MTLIGAQEQMIDLTGEKPDIVARMIMFCYYDRYPVSPDFEVVPGSKTVNQVMTENKATAGSSAEILTEPKYDSLVHLQMFDFAKRFEMADMAIYANKRCKKTIANENEGFWDCVAYMNTIERGVAEKVERKMLRLVESSSWTTVKPFEELTKLRPEMAAKVSQFGRRRFGQRG
jgi:hypothetical protein